MTCSCPKRLRLARFTSTNSVSCGRESSRRNVSASRRDAHFREALAEARGFADRDLP